MEAIPVQQQQEELNLVDLFQICIRRRRLIMGVIAACLLIGIAAIVLMTPRYEVEVRIDRPYENEVALLNLGRTSATGLRSFSSEQVFGYFTREVLSGHAFERFFRELYLPSLSEEQRQAPEAHLLKAAQKFLAVKPPDERRKGQLPLYSVTLAADDPDKAVQWMTGFLERAAHDAKQKLIADARAGLEVTMHNAQRDLDELRLTAQRKRLDRAQRLTEALVVANAVGLRDPQVTAVRPPSSDQMSPFMDGSSLYARGAKSLSAELGVLEDRVDDDAFISGLRDTESKLRLWEAVLQSDVGKFDVYRLDGEIVTPVDPVKPKKGLVLALALTLGAIGGVLLAFIVEAISNSRAKLPPPRASAEYRVLPPERGLRTNRAEAVT
ncbi:MAG: Wzz/FepE/Etk N-terminal domain-containing protein [Burkholderiaceae bacterium]|jgi:chain length determinant protein (polysaccharide antigen chain regulator)|nr:Wzz/FepE/Etk N-terminal domain-containing protein [Burkholderiaceae bacterium]